jgi:hypothetical protein
MNKLIGGSLLLCVTLLTTNSMAVRPTLAAHGPVAPPDSDGDSPYVAHGPVAPPDSDGDSPYLAHGPVAPPDSDGDSPFAV